MGFICHQGTCISACNPACAANELCSPAGECVSACNPVCAANELCSPQATCVSACNPACAQGQTCTSTGECVASAAPPPAFAPGPGPAPIGPGPDQSASGANDWQTARQGTHFGLGLGAAYLPVNDITAGFVTVHLNVGLGRDDFRTTAGLGTVSGSSEYEDWTATTLFIAPQYQLNIGEVYSLSFGPLAGYFDYDGNDSYSTLILGPTASPAIFRIGSMKQMELGLTVFVVRNFHEDEVNPGGYVAFTYLFL